jgi:hypothetical protein
VRPSPFHGLLAELEHRQVRYALIGVGGANCYATDPSAYFKTYDRDLFLPLDPANLVKAWEACETLELPLTCSGEPLDYPRDLWLAERIVQNRALTKALLENDLSADFTLVMAGFDFDTVWRERRTFSVNGVDLHVARLSHIVTSKALAGRPKDHLFLATHAEALRELLPRDDPPPRP